MKVKSLSRVRPSATPWTAAHQAPLSMGFSRQEYWSGVPLPSPSIYHSYSVKPFKASFRFRMKQSVNTCHLFSWGNDWHNKDLVKTAQDYSRSLQKRQKRWFCLYLFSGFCFVFNFLPISCAKQSPPSKCGI